MADRATVDELKATANSLHSSGKSQEAYDKYSEAIKLDPDNAILYANRAASSITMHKWVLTVIFCNCQAGKLIY